MHTISYISYIGSILLKVKSNAQQQLTVVVFIYIILLYFFSFFCFFYLFYDIDLWCTYIINVCLCVCWWKFMHLMENIISSLANVGHWILHPLELERDSWPSIFMIQQSSKWKSHWSADWLRIIFDQMILNPCFPHFFHEKSIEFDFVLHSNTTNTEMF